MSLDRKNIVLSVGLAVACALPSLADDWPEWGRDASKNMVSGEKNIPGDIHPGTIDYDTEKVDVSTAKNLKWAVKLGSQSYGNVTVKDGHIYLGTNNEVTIDPKYTGDRSVALALDEETGKRLWHLSVPKMGSGKVNDWEYLGICSSPTVDGDRIYLVNNLCHVVCLDAKGLSDGNQGFQGEAAYAGGKGKKPIAQGPGDADILWVYDMMDELGVFPHNIASSSVLVTGDRVFVNTSNGVDWSHINIPSPRAPCLIALDKNTGKLLGEEASGISTRIYHGSWSSPAYGRVAGREMVVFGGGDGNCYGYDTTPKPDPDDPEYNLLTELWRVDCNPPEYKRTKAGKSIKYATPPGPSEIIATPVIYKQRIYVAIGQDPEHGEGVGNMVCLEPKGSGDLTKSAIRWQYKDINRVVSTVSIADGLVYVADFAGVVHCLDAESGKLYWKHDTQGHIWGSTLLVDGKVYIGNEDGFLTVLAAGKEKKLLHEIEFGVPIYASPIVANGVLYIQSHTHLYAFTAAKKSK